MLQISRYVVRSPRLPPAFDGFTLLQLADLHGASFGPGNAQLLEAVREVGPELIAVTGDMVNCTQDDGGAFTALTASLAREFPVYFVEGNHEDYIRRKQPAEYARIMRVLGRTGIFRLSNAGTFFKRGGESIAVYGLELPTDYYRPFFDRRRGALTRARLDEWLGRPPAVYTLLLTHPPFFFDAYAAWGADLTLAGHLHGGMVRLPLAGGLLSPDWTLFPRYDAGRFTRRREDGALATMLVSRGLGSNHKPRILNPPELVAVTLRGS